MTDSQINNLDNPEWDKAGRVHDWRNYVGKEVQAMWATFSDEQKQALYKQADDIAGREDWD